MSVYKNLLFMSSESTNSRTDCGFGGVPDPISKDRVRGIRVFDISDIKKPKLVTTVQTCRGSHTHTVVTQPGDNDNVYIYVSGTSGVRSADELPGLPGRRHRRSEHRALPPRSDQGAARRRRRRRRSSARRASSTRCRCRRAMPSATRPDAAVRRRGRARPARRAQPGAAAAPGAARLPPGAPGAPARRRAAPRAAGADADRQGPPTGPNQCHDITVYPEIGLAGGACAGLGLLLDIRDVAHPKRVDFVADPNMSFWHSATFSNDGKKVLFTDEWGGGSAPRCRDTDKLGVGRRRALHHREQQAEVPQLLQAAGAADGAGELRRAQRLAHPDPRPRRDGAGVVPGRPVGLRLDRRRPSEGDRLLRSRSRVAPIVSSCGGSWSAYWYNGLIVSSEIARGLDIYELLPSPLLSANEIAAAKTVKLTYWNTQDQQKIVWPPSFALARAYLDQLERSKGLAADAITSTRTALTTAERRSGAQRKTALTELAAKLDTAAGSARDAAKVKLLSRRVTDLANAPLNTKPTKDEEDHEETLRGLHAPLCGLCVSGHGALL